MSLRMNLYGWDEAAFEQAIGSNDSNLLTKATALLTNAYKAGPALSQALGWLRTLIENGSPLRRERGPSPPPDDGGLLTVLMETESHVLATYCLSRAIASECHLDLASESSHWSHPMVGVLYRELVSCGFTKSRNCVTQFFALMSGLSNGTPLFGDEFHTEWAFYGVFSRGDLPKMVSVLKAAVEFQRTLPRDYPESLAKTTATGLSEDCKVFAAELATWLGKIEQAGQDAFFLWW